MHSEEESKTEFKAWQTFSIFISSTFRDMQAEREYLKDIIFPKVEEELRDRRIKLEIVDLRWGIDTASIAKEDEREAKVLKVCLDEIRRCRPFFIGLLGDRYGWVPSEERMKNAVAGERGIKPGKNKSVTALEIEFGVLASKDQLSRSVFYFRDSFNYSAFPPEKAAKYCDKYDPELTDDEKKQRIDALNDLKGEIRKYFDKEGKEDKVKPYSTKWDEAEEKVTGLKEFGKLVYEDILEECKKHAADTWDQVPKDEHGKEIIRLEAFIEEHIDAFCGREKLLSTMKQHLMAKGKEKWGLVLTGESGSGKSAVFSKIYKEMQKENCFILAHSAGLSPASCKVYDLLSKWNRQLREFLEIAEKPRMEEDERLEALPSDNFDKSEKQPKLKIDKLVDKFKELLITAAEKKQIVLLIDALDRFEPTKRAEYMTWLPQVMPGNIRMLCTAITDTEKKATGYNKGLYTSNIEYFSERDAREMLNALSQQKHKTLPDRVIDAIFSHRRGDGLFSVSSPLWLSLVVNMLTALDSDDFEEMSRLEGRVDQQIESYITQMVTAFPDLPGDLFLDLIHKAGKVFGETFTQTVFDLIACSRNGLRESDLEKLVPEINPSSSNYAVTRNDKINIDWDPLHFAGIRRWFKKHLKEQGDNLQWNLAHSILRNSLLNKLDVDEFKNIHNAIAFHLLTLPEIDDIRISETMFHLMKAGNAEIALNYYIDCTPEERQGATTVLAEAVSRDEKKLEWCFAILRAAGENGDEIMGLAPRYIYDLNKALIVEGNLIERQKLLETLRDHIKTKINLSDNIEFGYDFAALNEKLGSIYQSLGKLDQALEFYNKYNHLMKELYESNPNNGSLIHSLAISYEKLGEIYQSLGKLDQALEFYNLEVDLFKELYESNPSNGSLKSGLAISYENLGSIYQSLGKLDQALEFYKEDNHLMIELYENNLRNESLKYCLAISYEKLGSIYQSLGKLDQALEFYNKDSHLMKELYESNPRNESLKNGLAISYSKLGSIFQSLSKLDQALEFYKEDNHLMIELYESNLSNENLKNGLAISYSKLGEIFQSLGKLDQALEFYNKDNHLMKELCENNPRNESLKNGLAISYGRLGDIYQFLGKLDQALEFYNKSNHLMKELYESNPRNIGLLEGLDISYYKLAVIYKAIGNDEAGRTNFAEWTKIISWLAENLPEVPKYQEWKRVEY